MVEKSFENAVEALLFVTDKPLSVDKLSEVMDDADKSLVKEAVESIKTHYASSDRSFELAEIAGGYQFVTKKEYSVWIAKLHKKAADKIRGASMETLAIIVYKQPITKAEIEAIRGVNSDGVVKTLMEKNLVRIKGRKDAPGRPLLYGTTNEFLVRFGLKDINSLPPLREFTEKDIDFGGETDDSGILPLESDGNTGGSGDAAPAEAPAAGDTAGAAQTTEKEGDTGGTEKTEG